MSKDRTPPRTRLSPEDRRQQLIGIGLRMLVDRPIQDLSIDAVAAEAGISRGLLFHHFATKSDFHDAVIDAALRRVSRNTDADPGVSGDEGLRQITERFYLQVDRRRDFYVALVFGSGALAMGADRVVSQRGVMARRVVDLQEWPESALTVAHAWIGYIEDRALQWSDREARPALESEVAHCLQALRALVLLEIGAGESCGGL